MTDKKTTLLLVDDHAIMRVGLASLLNTFDDFRVIDEAENGESALQKVRQRHPDVIIADLLMPGMDGAEMTRRIVEENPSARILILTTFGTSDGIYHALKAGAKGAILKNAEIEELAAAIRAVACGRRYLSAELERIMAEDPPVEELTPRQQEILSAIVRGLTSVDIAKTLGISPNMVREHTSILFRKLGAANRAEAVAIALRKQLVKN